VGGASTAALSTVSRQHPAQDTLQLQWPVEQLHRPPQHSNLGRLTDPKAKDCGPDALVGSIYKLVSIRSKEYEAVLRWEGGGGRAAARAKKMSKKLVPGPPEELLEFGRFGKAILVVGSMQVPHPSAQSLCS